MKPDFGRWIPLTESLPDPDVNVLVRNTDGIRVAYLSCGLSWWIQVTDTCGCCDSFDEQGISHWAHLPEAPL